MKTNYIKNDKIYIYNLCPRVYLYLYTTIINKHDMISSFAKINKNIQL